MKILKKLVSRACDRFTVIRKVVGLFMVAFAFAIALAVATGLACAQTDITGTVTALSGYWDTIAALAITVVLFVLGRRLLRKL